MVWSFTSASQQVTFWVVSISPSQWGQTAEMSPPVASERVSVVVTWLGSLLMRFFVTELLVGNIGNSFVPKSQSSLLSLLIKFQVDGDDDDGFFNGETTTPMFVSHCTYSDHFLPVFFLPDHSLTRSHRNHSLLTQHTAFVYQRPSVLLEEQPPPSHLPALPSVPSQVAKEAAVPWLIGWKYLNVLFVVWLPWIAQLPVRAFQQFTIPSPAHQLIHSNCDIGSVNLFNWEIEWACRILYNVLFLETQYELYVCVQCKYAFCFFQLQVYNTCTYTVYLWIGQFHKGLRLKLQLLGVLAAVALHDLDADPHS